MQRMVRCLKMFLALGTKERVLHNSRCIHKAIASPVSHMVLPYSATDSVNRNTHGNITTIKKTALGAHWQLVVTAMHLVSLYILGSVSRLGRGLGRLVTTTR